MKPSLCAWFTGEFRMYLYGLEITHDLIWGDKPLSKYPPPITIEEHRERIRKQSAGETI